MTSEKSVKNNAATVINHRKDDVSTDYSHVKRRSANKSKKQKYKPDDIIDIFLRWFVAFLASAFTSGVLTGLAESVNGWVISFDSLPVIIQTALFIYPWYWILTKVGLFRQKMQ